MDELDGGEHVPDVEVRHPCEAETLGDRARAAGELADRGDHVAGHRDRRAEELDAGFDRLGDGRHAGEEALGVVELVLEVLVGELQDRLASLERDLEIDEVAGT